MPVAGTCSNVCGNLPKYHLKKSDCLSLTPNCFLGHIWHECFYFIKNKKASSEKISVSAATMSRLKMGAYLRSYLGRG